jgi:hypothetical protein
MDSPFEAERPAVPASVSAAAASPAGTMSDKAHGAAATLSAAANGDLSNSHNKNPFLHLLLI